MDYTFEEIDTTINNAKPVLLGKLDLDVYISAKLRAQGVITSALEDSLKVEIHSPAKKVDLFLDDLKRGPESRFLRFCKIIEQEGRTHILTIMKVDMARVNSQLAKLTHSQTIVVPNANAAATVTAKDKVPIWDPGHPGGTVPLTRELARKLLLALPRVKDLTVLTDIWTHLRVMQVMTQAEVDRCKGGPGAEADQVERLINFLEKRPVWAFHAFLKALYDTRQFHVIDVILGDSSCKMYQ